MWPFKKKTVKDYISQIIRIAKRVKKDFKDIDKGRINNIIRLLERIKRFDLKQFSLIKKETGSRKLMKECEEVYNLTKEALKDINELYKFGKAEQVVDKIIRLETYISKDFENQIRFLPSKALKKILSFSPRQAVSKGYLFRGLTVSEYDKFLNNQDIFAKDPNADISLLDHVLNNPNETQFISLTADVGRARHFGGKKVVAVKMTELKGNLLYPKDIERDTGGDTQVKKLLKKNSEFVLSPSKTSFACIPNEAIVN